MSVNIKKTNAMRILDINRILYENKKYNFDGENYSGEKVANQVGLPSNQVYKTLVVQDTQDSRNIAVGIIAVDNHLDLKLMAKSMGVKKVEMLPVGDILKVTGYVRGGCSPIGMKKDYPIYIDRGVKQHEKVAVSAGVIGQQVFLSSDDLIKTINAKSEDIISY